MLKELYSTATNLIYENTCGVCKLPTANEFNVCSSCDPRKTLLAHSFLLTPPYCLKCGECLSVETSSLCQNCILYPLPIDHIRSIWSYTGAAESLICAFKYKNSRTLSNFFVELLVTSLKSGSYPPAARYNWDLILPLPSTSSSLAKRGFSPIGEVVKGVSKKLNTPYSLLSLRTVGDHPPQASLSPNLRLKHMEEKFSATAKVIRKKNLLLIDDVITSGASIVGASTALLKAGASRIDCLSICRSELFSQMRRDIYGNI